MPEVAEAPVAPAAAPAPAPAASPSTTNYSEPSAMPSVPAKPGSARERMHRDTAKKLNLEEPPSAVNTPKPADAPKAEAPRPGEATPPDSAPETPPADVPPEDKKKNPWKLYRAEKERATALERQISEAKTGSLAETEKAQYLERIEKAEAKLKTYEDEIRFKSYEKSDEFKTKYEQPYEQAWNRHMAELRQVPVLAADGTQRLATPEDLLELVNLPLGEARKLANEKWGDFSQDAMTARKECRDLFEAKNIALEEARKTGSEREKQMQEQGQKWRTDTTKHVTDTWKQANEAALSDPNNGEFFKPAEGDETRNQLLGKGFALVDKAFSENPYDPKLTPEQRADVVKRHAAVRNRAAAYAPMKYLLNKLRAEVAALKKSNGQLKGSEPPRAGGTQANGAPASTSARDRMRAAGEKWAK